MPTAMTKLRNTLMRAISNLGIIASGNKARTVRKPGKKPSVKSPRSILNSENTGAGLLDATKAVSAAGITTPA